MTTDYTALGELVSESRQLLDLIKGGAINTMQTEHTQALAKFNADATAFLANMQDAVPNLALSGNQTLQVAEGATIPSLFGANERVTMTRVTAIDGQPQLRTAEMKAMLADIEAGVKTQFPDFSILANNHYRDSFNIFRVSWDFSNYDKTPYLCYPLSNSVGIPIHNIKPLTSAALIKLESGSLIKGNSYFAEGAVLGEWRYCYTMHEDTHFGSYIYAHPFPASETGSFLMALPVVATGYLNRPEKLFTIPEIG
ncbi:hypothetical protein VITU102760_12240 [Vibrio tubiashii]|uniref:Uncharacterized protein n=1 Tax=Vibrio tubiashii ATCC 19109 TaxID=1051646 RepID=F9SZZ0_9VIBR|nr:hypothetical protein [Vibrio tubiashii]AIW16281.1 hypothetical protein IX91_19495 [Vibrio tubiashii ATCC 19109]EGU59068.1 hypothetical protein VITU9109_18980 [Vibrio tubiashii ATCC 19109]EIF05930.1 hypothetical protein VT1337_00780 [Vibrio tubiashii NCIMB 1337 = ATCC 19106]